MSRLKSAERGAALLDERLPGWSEQIDVENLALHNGCNCVLGQLFGTYERGCELLGLDWVTHRESRRLGFYKWPRSSWLRLTEAWRALIEQRRAGRR